MSEASEGTKNALRSMVAEVVERSQYLRDLPRSYFIQLSDITSQISQSNEILSTLEGILHLNGENILEFCPTNRNIWSPDLLIKWHEEQKEALQLRDVYFDITACKD